MSTQKRPYVNRRRLTRSQLSEADGTWLSSGDLPPACGSFLLSSAVLDRSASFMSLTSSICNSSRGLSQNRAALGEMMVITRLTSR